MPLFEYECPGCSDRFELLVRREEPVACPSCGNADPQKLLSAPAAHVASRGSLPMVSQCPPSNAPPCHPHCCRLP